jgi:hypothetical protein
VLSPGPLCFDLTNDRYVVQAIGKPSHEPVEVFPTPIIEESIEDDGAGITEKSLRWLFEPGFRVGERSRRLDGRGLGLAFVKRAMTRSAIARISEETGIRRYIDSPKPSMFCVFCSPVFWSAVLLCVFAKSTVAVLLTSRLRIC